MCTVKAKNGNKNIKKKQALSFITSYCALLFSFAEFASLA